MAITSWGLLRFRQQLLIVLAVAVTVALSLQFIFTVWNFDRTFIRRSFDLLRATHTQSTHRLRELDVSMSELARNCEANTSFLSKSPFYLGKLAVNTLSEPEIGQSERVFDVKCERDPGKAFRFDMGILSQLFTDRTGLGESGETYLMTVQGKLITESRFVTTPGHSPIPPSFEKKWEGIKKDYRGIPVLGVWSQLSFLGQRVILASEIDEAEIRGPRSLFLRWSGIFLFFFNGAVLALAPFLSRLLSKNIERDQELQKARYSALIEGQERERKRISMEIHDDIGQQVIALRWKVASQAISQQEITDDLEQIGIRLRDLTADISTAILSDMGLAAAAEELLEKMKAIAELKKIELTYHIKLPESVGTLLPYEAKVNVYRVLQEAATNMIKYSQASKSHFELTAVSHKLLLEVTDNGVGMDSIPRESMSSKMGLRNMQSRIEAIGGRFKIFSERNKGLSLSAVIPLST